MLFLIYHCCKFKKWFEANLLSPKIFLELTATLSAAEGGLKGLFQSDECKNRLTKISTNNTKIKCKKVLKKYVRMTKSSNKVVIEDKEKTPQGASKNYLLVSYIAYFYIWIDIIGSVIWNIARMFSVVF